MMLDSGLFSSICRLTATLLLYLHTKLRGGVSWGRVGLGGANNVLLHLHTERMRRSRLFSSLVAALRRLVLADLDDATLRTLLL